MKTILKVLSRFNYLSVKQMNAESKQSQISKKNVLSFKLRLKSVSCDIALSGYSSCDHFRDSEHLKSGCHHLP